MFFFSTLICIILIYVTFKTAVINTLSFYAIFLFLLYAPNLSLPNKPHMNEMPEI